MKKQIIAVALAVSGLFAGNVLACGGDGSGMHIGKVVAIDSSGKTFTIKDMESQKPITFNASDKLLAMVQKRGGTLQVHYEQNDEGALKAVSIN
ncbi:MAG: hypothetical protein OEW58_03020 [Gammaproteobacteria bacterium]|nr:hypothetical protein [Gammaproteobacteria bacterium]